MPKVLYRFPTGEGLVHLLDPSLFDHVAEDTAQGLGPASTAEQDDIHRRGIDVRIKQHQAEAKRQPLPRLEIEAVHHSASTGLNGVSTVSPSLNNIINNLARFRFHQLVCDFDETITEHDTTCSFDVLRQQIYEATGGQEQDGDKQCLGGHLQPHSPSAMTNKTPPPQPRLTWDEILDAYLDDLANVQVGDLDHLHCDRKSHKTADHPLSPSSSVHQPPQPQSQAQGGSVSMDAKTNLALTDPCLLPWFKTQVRRRSAEEASLRRVFESGNIVGLTSAQIREYGRRQVRLRRGLVDLLLARTSLSADGTCRKQQQGIEGGNEEEEEEEEEEEAGQVGGLWILSVNWSQDLIRGAMDQVFEHPEVTDRMLPASRLVSSNLEFISTSLEQTDEEQSSSLASTLSTTTGRIHARCLTGCDKLEAFRAMQAEFASQNGLASNDTQWAYLGDSLTDLGCLVEADLGIIIGTSNSLLVECERAGIQVIDLRVVQDAE